MYLFVGIIAYAMAGKDVMRMTGILSLADANDPEAVLARMVPVVVAGFRAPSGGRVAV